MLTLAGKLKATVVKLLRTVAREAMWLLQAPLHLRTRGAQGLKEVSVKVRGRGLAARKG